MFPHLDLSLHGKHSPSRNFSYDSHGTAGNAQPGDTLSVKNLYARRWLQRLLPYTSGAAKIRKAHRELLVPNDGRVSLSHTDRNSSRRNRAEHDGDDYTKINLEKKNKNRPTFDSSSQLDIFQFLVFIAAKIELKFPPSPLVYTPLKLFRSLKCYSTVVFVVFPRTNKLHRNFRSIHSSPLQTL